MDTVLDNIGLPYSTINLTHTSSGVIGAADADIMVSLKPGHRRATSPRFAESWRASFQA